MICVHLLDSDLPRLCFLFVFVYAFVANKGYSILYVHSTPN